LDHAGFANRRIVLDSKQEAGHETVDRVWRRWKSYCVLAGVADDPFLVALSYETKHLLVRSFFGLYRDAKWSLSGKLEGRHKEPLVSGTIKTAASCLAAAFWNDFQPSPIHIKGGTHFHPGIKALFKAFDNVDPPTKRQKAITPKLLRKLLEASQHSAIIDTAPAVVADLVIGAFFFAMRACEYTKPRSAGRTKCIDLAGIVFRTKNNAVIAHDNPRLLELAEYVTITFVNQKNGIKMDSRTQRRTKDPILCPVIRYAIQVQRILRTVPDASGSTTINTIATKGKAGLITSTYVLQILRATCSSFGGKAIFGFNQAEIGNKSIRSGAAMALFINDVPTAKIMILGRWSSDAFLAYIRPQVLEWTNNMSREMITVDSFFDVQMNHHTTAADPRTRANRYNTPFNGPAVVIPRLHLNH
jgi:hypothetical protein